MKKTALVLCLLLGVAHTASAQNSSLRRYSDRALVQELGARGYQCGPSNWNPPPPPPPSVAQVLNVTCDQYTNMFLELYEESGTKIAALKYFMGSNSTCQSERSRIMAEFSNGRLYKTTTIAFCDPYTNMIRVKFSSSDITEVDKTFNGSNSSCNTNADQFNALF